MNFAGPSVEQERWYFILFALLVLLYAALRATLVPWVHDESTSIYWFLERETFLPYVALWDAGNHFLSSAIGIAGHKIWGLSLAGSRIGSLLAFPVFAWAVFRIGSMIRDRPLRWVTWLALLICPFLLDFFSLFRGYGLGMAFWMLAVDGGFRYYCSRTTRPLLQLLLALFLADMAFLSLVPLWALAVFCIGVHLLYEWRTRKHAEIPRLLIYFFCGVLPLLFGLLLAWEMRRRGMLYHGSTEGFIPVTLASLSQFVLGTRHAVVLALVTLLIVTASGILLVRARSSPFILLAVLLWADVCMRMGMALILKVNYPEDRAALHLVPLSILVVAFAADALIIKWRWAKTLLMASLLVLPLRSLATVNLDHTQLWPEQSVPTRFLEHIRYMQKYMDRPVMVGVYHQTAFSFPYAARVNEIPLNPPDAGTFPLGPHDMRIVDQRFVKEALIGYTEIDIAPGPGLHLLRRTAPMVMQHTNWVAIPTESVGGAEFVEVWAGDGTLQQNALLVEVRCKLGSTRDPLDLMLVTSLERDGEAVHYQAMPTAHLRRNWSGEEFHVMVHVPSIPADRRVIYFWNPDNEPVAIGDLSMRIHVPPADGQ